MRFHLKPERSNAHIKPCYQMTAVMLLISLLIGCQSNGRPVNSSAPFISSEMRGLAHAATLWNVRCELAGIHATIVSARLVEASEQLSFLRRLPGTWGMVIDIQRGNGPISTVTLLLDYKRNKKAPIY
jgi:hypothetical protein